MNQVKLDNIRIPNGQSCRKCNAIVVFSETSGHYGRYYCYLFKTPLTGSYYDKPGVDNKWSHNRGWAIHKCEKCIEKYKDN